MANDLRKLIRDDVYVMLTRFAPSRDLGRWYLSWVDCFDKLDIQDRQRCLNTLHTEIVKYIRSRHNAGSSAEWMERGREGYDDGISG